MIPFLHYADLFTITLRNDDVQEFDTRWDEILLSMTMIPPDDVLESLYKLRYVSLINSKPNWNGMTLFHCVPVVESSDRAR